MTQAIAMPTIAQFVSANPNADPKEMLAVVMAETERLRIDADRLKIEAAASQQEWKELNEVAIDPSGKYVIRTLGQLQRLGVMFATSGIVPDHYSVLNREEYAKKVAACSIGIQMAIRCGVDIPTFLQCSFVHKGKVGIESKLAMAMLNTSGKIRGRVHYKLEGDIKDKTRRCTAWAIDAATGEEFSQTVDWSTVEGEGWNKDKTSQSGYVQKSKWNTMPDLMFQYRAGIFLCRVHYSDVLLGMQTVEELEDVVASNGGGTATAAAPTGLDELSEHLGATLKPKKTRKSKADPLVPENEPTREEESQPETFSPEKQPAGSEKQPAVSPSPPNVSATARPARASKGEEPATAPRGNPATPAAIRAKPAAAAAAAKADPQKPAIDDLKTILRTEWPDDFEAFDIDAICKQASKQTNPREYIDSIMLRKNPQWHSFVLREENQPVGPADDQQVAEGEAFDDGLAAEDVSQESSSEETAQEMDRSWPLAYRVPMGPPPHMSSVAVEFEKSLVGYRQLKRIKDCLFNIDGNPKLTPDEKEYLNDVADDRTFELEQGLAPSYRTVDLRKRYGIAG